MRKNWLKLVLLGTNPLKNARGPPPSANIDLAESMTPIKKK